MTFARGLRAILRQDPDVVLVGEIRDKETAELALRASLTGHLVLSTVHTNGAAQALTRLVDMEMAPYLVASSLNLVGRQRLVRRVCEACAEPYVPSDEILASLAVDLEHAHTRPPPSRFRVRDVWNDGLPRPTRSLRGAADHRRAASGLRPAIRPRRPCSDADSSFLTLQEAGSAACRQRA